jgi:hypothetical protein
VALCIARQGIHINRIEKQQARFIARQGCIPDGMPKRDTIRVLFYRAIIPTGFLKRQFEIHPERERFLQNCPI